MVDGAGAARVRGVRTGVLAAAVASVVLAPGPVRADPPRRRTLETAAHGNGNFLARGPVTVALGATGGSARERALLHAALTDAIGENPALRLATDGAPRAAYVLTANVRTLTVQHGPAGALARCDVGVVVADGGGAVRAMLDVIRVVHGDARATDDSLERTAVRGVATGALRDVVSQVLR